MKDFPDSVFINWLSRISLNIWTCGANSLPYAAVAIRQPPPSFSSGSYTTTEQTPSGFRRVPGPQIPNFGSSNPTAW